MSDSRFAELRLLLAYAVIALRPGAKPPAHPKPLPDLGKPPEDWTDADRETFIAESRRAIDGQRADKQDVRSRAQVLLTTCLVLGGAVIADASRAGTRPVWVSLLYAAAFAAVALSGMAAAGVITGRSDIGAPQLHNLVQAPKTQVTMWLVEEYAASALTGGRTVAVLVTVLRSAVLLLIVGFAFFAVAHIAST